MIGFTVKKSGRFVTNPKRVTRDLGDQLMSDMRVASLHIHSALKAELSSKPKVDPFWGVMGGWPGLHARTGGTRRRLSPGGRVYKVGNVLTTAVGSPDQHVLDAEEGGTFTASSGFFRIPTKAAMTRSGVDRMAGLSLRARSDLFLFKTKKGNLWVAKRGGTYGPMAEAQAENGRGKPVLMYLLKKTITRKARHIFARVTKETRDDVVRQVGRGVALQTQRANQ